jgi:hypothetical protein
MVLKRSLRRSSGGAFFVIVNRVEGQHSAARPFRRLPSGEETEKAL